MGLATIDLNNISLDDDNLDKNEPANIVLVRLLEQRKECRK